MRGRRVWLILLALPVIAIVVAAAVAVDSGKFPWFTGQAAPSASAGPPTGTPATGTPAPDHGQSPATVASHPCGWLAAAPRYRHVIWIWLENKSYRQIIGSTRAPYLNSLARECGVADNYHNVTHPSLPNYLAATSGLAVSSAGLPWTSYLDCDPGVFCGTAAASIFGQGETWRAYAESMPSDCDRSASGEYAPKHNPAVYYTTLRGCAAGDVPYSRLTADLADGRLAAFSFITPNLTDDMHDGTVADGDRWLRRNLPAILRSPEYASGTTAVFITWDEGDGGTRAERCQADVSDESCHVPALVISPSTPAGTRPGTLFSHYSLLGTAEQLLGLPALGQAARSPTMTEAFRL